ncbi:MAG: aminoacyl-tRNA hydrolase [Verrucomicrobia bacterium]|nr:aminoacyl-tRNA hydrolase [Verrucomicrobiota bacterium]
MEGDSGRSDTESAGLCLIAGLGNPGAKYKGTRHNAGFMVVERLVQRWNAELRERKAFVSMIANINRAGRKIILCLPLTYMNLSGDAVVAVAGFYKIRSCNTLVIVDDADLPLGAIRMKPGGGSGGHHGLESIEGRIGTNAFPRLRLGVGRGSIDNKEIVGHVLQRFSVREREVFEKVLDRAVEQVECWLMDGVEKAMSKFNGSIIISENSKKTED